MSKKYFLGMLDKLGKLLADNATVQQAIEQLKSALLASDETLFQTTAPADKTQFVVPAEISGDHNKIALFTDGACRGNPGPGAWAAIAQDANGQILFESTSVEVLTTNNRMELEAAIQGLQLLRTEHSLKTIHVYSDSKYVVEGASQWLNGWKRRNWLKSDNKPPENVELWKNLDGQMSSFPATHWHWVKGHAGHPQNEYCDQLANKILNESGF